MREEPESLLDILAGMRSRGVEIPPALLELTKLQDQLDADGLSSGETARYVRLLDELGLLKDEYRYLLSQPLTATDPPPC